MRRSKRARLCLVGAGGQAHRIARLASSPARRGQSRSSPPSPCLRTIRRSSQAKVQRLSFAKAIKLKLDGNLDVDRERIAVVRRERPDAWLGVDANQGFVAQDLEELGRAARDYSISLIEQPLKRGDEASLEGWRPGIPIAADESILDLSELQERGQYFDVINVKLDKCGGLTEALQMARTTEELGKQLMVGNMGGSTLAMAPGFVLGQLCDIVDLDGPYGLADDPLAAQIYDDGRIFVPETIWGSRQ